MRTRCSDKGKEYEDSAPGSAKAILARLQLKLLGSIALIVAGALLAPRFVASQVETAAPVVYVVRIEGVIDLGLAPFVKRVIAEAVDAKAAAVILEIDTFGGRVDAAVQIRDALLDADVRTVGHVNKRAISAGALIGLATETLMMATGSTIGAAAPVQMGAPGTAAQASDEKTVSYVRKEFRATAEARRRPLLLAEAMVDADVEVPDVVDRGKLLTLTTDEALAHRIADFRADTVESVLSQLGIEGAEIRDAAPHWAERLVRFLTDPLLSSLLISVGLLGIFVEMRTPGFGLAGGIGVGSLALFFWGHWLVELAGFEELLLVGAAIALLAAEVFFIPGFGVAGLFGIGALLAAFVLSLTGEGDAAAVVVDATWRVVIALLVALFAGLGLLRFLPRLQFARRFVLESTLGSGPVHGSAPVSDQTWLGKSGYSASPLRPAGIADIEGERVDVVSDGAMIEPNTPVQVTHVDGNRIVVRQIPQHPLYETPPTRSEPWTK